MVSVHGVQHADWEFAQICYIKHMHNVMHLKRKHSVQVMARLASPWINVQITIYLDVI